mgnify:CR=1 FL=1
MQSNATRSTGVSPVMTVLWHEIRWFGSVVGRHAVMQVRVRTSPAGHPCYGRAIVPRGTMSGAVARRSRKDRPHAQRPPQVGELAGV